MSIRDLLLNVLIAIGLTFTIIFVAVADSLPMIVLIVLAMIVWVIYVILVIRDHQRDIRYPIVRYRPNESLIPSRVAKTPQTAVYDQQEEEKR